MTKSPLSIHSSQSRAIAFLSNSSNYLPQSVKVERIETHGAYIFLAGKDAFKMKRAVSFSYMNFSTLDLRYSACKREMELNAPHAPEIYKGLKSITEEKDGSLVFDGEGTPIEWVVHMNRFHEKDLLMHVASAGPFSNQLSKMIAEMAFSYHQGTQKSDDHNSASQIQKIVEDVIAALKRMIPFLNEESLLNLETNLKFYTTKLSPLLIRRQKEGFVRRCHGDMHLSNIVLIEGKPVLFDALEFSEEMATIDVLYDLAFLLMDLDHREQRTSANLILNRYLWLSSDLKDIEGLELLPLFLSLRAAIRGMVRGHRALQTSGLEQTNLMNVSQAYIERATTFFKEKPLCLILIGGLSGSGKSTLAAQLAPDCGRSPGALHLRSDLERKRLFTVKEYDQLPQDYYSEANNERVYLMMLSKAEAALRSGHSVIADAVFAKTEERERMERLANRHKAQLFTYWLDAPTSVLINRVNERIHDASDATAEIVMKQMHYDLGNLTWERIDARGTPEQIVFTVKEKMKERLRSL